MLSKFIIIETMGGNVVRVLSTEGAIQVLLYDHDQNEEDGTDSFTPFRSTVKVDNETLEYIKSIDWSTDHEQAP